MSVFAALVTKNSIIAVVIFYGFIKRTSLAKFLRYKNWLKYLVNNVNNYILFYDGV